MVVADAMCVFAERGLHQTRSASESNFKAGQCLIKICFLVALHFCNCINSSCDPSWSFGKEGSEGGN